MKFLFVLIACAVLLGGYPAECHALGLEDCASTTQVLDDCDRDASGKSAISQCPDCADCGSPTVASATKVLAPILSVTTVYTPALTENFPQGRIFSLLRPPRTAA